MKIRVKKYKVISGQDSYEFVTTRVDMKIREKVLVKKNTQASPVNKLKS